MAVVARWRCACGGDVAKWCVDVSLSCVVGRQLRNDGETATCSAVSYHTLTSRDRIGFSSANFFLFLLFLRLHSAAASTTTGHGAVMAGVLSLPAGRMHCYHDGPTPRAQISLDGVKEVIRDLDENGDGMIDYKEFTKVISSTEARKADRAPEEQLEVDDSPR